ncbi:MAG TPA: SMC-Scp complex subunit ScpB [Sphingobacteriaceae bacterium]|nr:SMC-Scp complex subunit ScpB [Sphingobacteriaceae bacterium]
MKLQLKIEALIFASENGIGPDEIREVLQDPELEKEGVLQALIQKIKTKYDREDSILELQYLSKAYQFLTKKEYHETINQLQSHRSKKRLSQAALETLAIIAYRQPITKLEMEHIRGVNCDYSIQRLLEKDLISILGKSEGPGRPLLYGTSDLLMDYFGINDLSELPKLKEIVSEENTIGSTQE